MSLAESRKRVPALCVGLGISTLCLSVSAYAMSPSPIIQDEGQDEQEAMTDRARGEAALAEADAHLEAGRWQAAADAYSAAINFFGDDEANRELRIRAEAGLTDALSRLDQAGRLEEVQQDTDLLRQRALAEFDAAYENSVALLEQDQFQDANNTILTANIRLQTARVYLTESEYTERAQRAEELMSQIEATEEAHMAAEAERIRQELEDQQQREEEAAREAREEQIHQLLLQVRDDQLERNYSEALSTIDHILFLDPENPVALALRDAVETAALWQSYVITEREKEQSYSWQMQDNREAAIAPRPNFGPGPRSTTGLMQYPEDWPTLSIVRTSGAGYLDNEANRMVAMGLETELPSVEFQNNKLAQVVDFLGTVASVNIQPDWKNLSFIGVEPEDRVNLAMRNVPVRTVLEHVLGQLGEDAISAPRYAIQDGLVVISSEEAIRQHVLTLTYDIRDLLFEVPYFDNAPLNDLEDVLDNGANRAMASMNASAFQQQNPYRANPADEEFGGAGEFFRDPDENPLESREVLVNKIVNLIQNNIDPDGWADFGGDTGRISEWNGSLVITQTPRNHQNIEGLLSQLREIRALQINIETRFLTVDMNWFEKIGFDLDLFFNTNDTVFDQAKAVDPLFHLGDFFTDNGRLKDPLIFDSFSQTNDFSNQIAFGQQFGIPTGTPPTDITYITGPVGPPIRPTEGWSPINFQQDSFNLVDLLGGFGSDSFAATVLAGNPALSVGIQFLDDVQVDLLIQATQADRRNVVLTAPRLTLFNGQRAWVQVGRQQAIVSSLTPILGDASGAFAPGLTALTDGVVMDVEAVISADRRYVTLTIITGVVEIVNIETLEFSGAAGGGGLVGGGATEFSGTISLPEIQVTQVNTSASVPDRGTLLIGGQRIIEEVEVEAGSPVFSKIPWINRFFTNRVTSKDESTLLILIRPEIIIQQENEDLLFPGLSDDLGGL
jgi:general secretion pathway protein D